MKELAIDTNEIVENGFGEIVETGKNVEAEEIAVENVEEAAEVVGDVTETEILDELNALLESLTDSDLIKLAYEVMNSSADYVMLSKGVNDSCINDISTAIEEVTTAHHNTLRKLMDAYSTLLERIKANKDNGVENTIETELFYKLKHVREKLTGNKAVDSAYTAILSATKSVHNIETGLNACNVLSEAFDTIIKNNGIYCESINKLLDIYISMLSK